MKCLTKLTKDTDSKPNSSQQGLEQGNEDNIDQDVIL